MMKRMTMAHRAAVLGLTAAVAVGGTAGAADKAERSKPWRELLRISAPESPGSSDVGKRLQPHLKSSADLGNKYLDKWIDNREWDKATGGLLIAAGFYGAAVTAFNPAPKNLKAAILASGTAAGLNTGLKFRGRGAAYRQGHHAMACLVETASPLMTYDTDHLQDVKDMRQQAANALATADWALKEAGGAKASGPANKSVQAQLDALVARLDAQSADAERKTLQERMKVLADLDKALAEERGAYEGAGERAAWVRRQIQEAVDKSLDGVSPDYAAVAKAMGETAQPAAGPGGEPTPGESKAGDANKSKSLLESLKPQPPTIAQALVEVNAAIRKLETDSPTVATKAHKAMAECIPKAG